MGQLEHAHQELRLQGSQSAGFMILSDSPATSNLDESYRCNKELCYRVFWLKSSPLKQMPPPHLKSLSIKHVNQ
ncbi:hypothetical protein NQZ68_005926 [Dissostichus eleginoides]|nr:hypothetical protein NQZ68_005926 [Dissostichus eleginoides]